MLLDLLKDIAAEEGLSLDTPEHVTLATVRANQAARELYDSSDLKDSIRECVFDFNQGEAQVALPWFVDQVRGMRYYDNRMPITPEAASARYNDGVGNELWYLKWRQRENSILQREISNESQIVFQLPLPEDADVEIYVAGPTANSSKISETVIIPVGETQAITVGNYISPLISLAKKTLTKYDVYAYDVDGNQLALIPNCLFTSYYTIYQIIDSISPIATTTFSAVEVMFKRKYVPMEELTDEFICGSRYEKAIYWKYMEHRSKDIDSAMAYQVKCNQIITQIESNEKAGKRERINFIAGPWFKLPYSQSRVYQKWVYENSTISR